MTFKGVWWTVLCFFKLLFQRYKYQQANIGYIFWNGNKLNIVFIFVILISENYINRNKRYVSKTFLKEKEIFGFIF